jgi:ribosome-associated translation inhibitor RaiA
MHVLINSDHHITGDETLTERVETLVHGRLGRFEDRITTVQVHLNDVNGAKLGGHDKRALMEARLGGLRPIAVSNEAPTILQAMEGAVAKLEHAIERTLGRLADKRRPAPREGEIASIEELQELEAAEKGQKNAPR